MSTTPPRIRRARLALAVSGSLGVIALTAGPAAALGDYRTSCSSGVAAETATPMFAHFQHAHLERSPMQQVADAQDTQTYIALHQAWIESFSAPGAAAATGIATGTPTPFMAHMEHAHIKRSPTDQVSDASDYDKYALVHTVLIQNMAQPATDALAGSPSC